MSDLFSKKLTEALALCGKSQSEIAHLAGITPPYLSDLKKGKKGNPSRDIVRNLAQALNVEISWLSSSESTPLENPDPTQTSPRISDQEIQGVSAEIFELCVRPIYQAKDEASLWKHHHLLLGRAQNSPNDLWITLLIITLQEIELRRADDAQKQAAEILSNLTNQKQSQ